MKVQLIPLSFHLKSISMKKTIAFLWVLLSVSFLFAQNNEMIVTHDRPNHQEILDRPYVVMVSIDGFRYDYAKKYGAKNIEAIANQGVQAASLIPCFPSSTFPNHYSIVTGMYPSSHGLVSNTFYRPSDMKKYRISDREVVSDGAFYGGKPIWVAAEQQGMRSASFFWVGSEADIEGIFPANYYRYNKSVPYKKRVKQVNKWLNEPPETRPHFITLYFSVVDSKGHAFGPDSDQVRDAVLEVDAIIGMLWKKLQKTDLPVNMILVSDHGMQQTKNDEPIFLKGQTDLSDYDIAPSSGVINLLYAKNESVDIEKTIEELKAKAEGRYKVYRPEEVPEHLNYSDNDRLGDIVVYSLAPYVFGNPAWKPSPGAHGFDPYQAKDVHGIFYAIGPHFQSGVTLDSFENIHVYPAVMKILQLEYDAESIDGDLAPLAPGLKTE